MSKHPFEYHKPTDDEITRMALINESMRNVYDLILDLVPGNAERTLAIRKLQEARMWVNAAILELDR